MTNDWARAINARVSTRMVVEHYGIRVSSRGYCKCPFHSGGNERTASMMVYTGNSGFHCFACNATGDTIKFVEKLFDVDFRDACRKINDDMALGLELDGKMTPQRRREINEQAYQRRKALENEAKRQKELDTAYWNAFDRWLYFDKVISNFEKNGDIENPTDEYITAKCGIANAKYVLDCAEFDLREYEKRDRGA